MTAEERQQTKQVGAILIGALMFSIGNANGNGITAKRAMDDAEGFMEVVLDRYADTIEQWVKS